MKAEEKYKLILEMKSIGEWTAGEYPSEKEFKQAIHTGRVCGTYSEKIVIVSNNPRENYTFVADKES